MLHRPDPDSERYKLIKAVYSGASNSLFSNLAFTETGSVTISKAKKFFVLYNPGDIDLSRIKKVDVSLE